MSTSTQKPSGQTPPDLNASKADLRRELRARRNALGATAQAAAAQALIGQLAQLPGWPRSRRIALYLAADGEIDTGPLALEARRQDRQLYLPVIDLDQHLDFALWEEADPLAVNRYGIGEPDKTATRIEPSQLDILFLPLVGWDTAGGRLGMGGGFYDRSLQGVSGPLLVGLAHDCQRVERVPTQDWDIKLDFVATGSALHHCRSA